MHFYNLNSKIMDVFLIFFYLLVVSSDLIFYEKIMIFFKYLGMKYILQEKMH